MSQIKTLDRDKVWSNPSSISSFPPHLHLRLILSFPAFTSFCPEMGEGIPCAVWQSVTWCVEFRCARRTAAHRGVRAYSFSMSRHEEENCHPPSSLSDGIKAPYDLTYIDFIYGKLMSTASIAGRIYVEEAKHPTVYLLLQDTNHQTDRNLLFSSLSSPFPPHSFTPLSLLVLLTLFQ